MKTLLQRIAGGVVLFVVLLLLREVVIELAPREVKHSLFHLSLWIVALVVPALVLLLGWLYVRVLRPIQKLTSQMSGVAEGDFTLLEQPTGGVSEVESLRQALLVMVQHIRYQQDMRRAYTEALTDGQEAERRRIAAELHDDTMQSLIVVGQRIDMAKQWVESAPQNAFAMLKAARDCVNEAAISLRHLITDLRPPSLEELGLVPALNAWADHSLGVRLEINIRGMERRVDGAIELALFRVTQEALANAQRHGRATQVTLDVDYQPNGVWLHILDNGSGFVIPDHLTELVAGGHYGLVGIQERVKQLGGSVQFASVVGKGTRIDIFVPSMPVQQPEGTVRDPVCYMLLRPNQAYDSLVYEGKKYYFCCPVCKGSFQHSPERYVQSTPNVTA